MLAAMPYPLWPLYGFFALVAVIKAWPWIEALEPGTGAFVGAFGGLVAILLGAYANADQNRRRDDRLRRQERAVLAVSLCAEIVLARQAIQGVLNILKLVINGTHPVPLAQDGKTDLTFTVLDSIEGTIFRANAGRIGALVDPELANETVIFHASVTWLRKQIREQYALNPGDARLNAQEQLTKMLERADTLIDGLSRVTEAD